MNFSVVLIGRNEATTLPRMLTSLAEFKAKGGEVVYVDTGSADKSAEVAEGLGAKVTCVGERFLITLSEDRAREINQRFVVEGDASIVSAGDKIFDYASARNYAASLATNDLVAMPDCDEEYTKLDLDALNQIIASGVEQLEYDFVFAHDERGRELIKFRHSKFYHRRKLKWVGIVHEILSGSARSQYISPGVIKLEHWQIPNENRSRYLAGLALDCFLHPENDRNSHYLAREMMYRGRYRSAIREFERHVTLNGWPAERAQSYTFIGDCRRYLGAGEEEIVKAYHDAIQFDGERREPWIKLAEYYFARRDHSKAASYAGASLVLPWRDFYANNVAHYREVPHMILYPALWWMGDQAASFRHWQQAEVYSPSHPRVRGDSQFYLTTLDPMVSVVIPTLTRCEAAQQLALDVPNLAGWDNLEVILEVDHNQIGAPRTVKRAVAKARGEFVLFLGDDCRPHENFVLEALRVAFQQWPRGEGLVALNDGQWNGTLATHWLAHRDLLPKLDGEFFHTGYHHVGCDNELTARCRQLGRYAYAEKARIDHHHPTDWSQADECHRLAWSKVDEDRALLRDRAAKLGFELFLP
jgi:glycosyltransferase involved in cell wall biosynthesis